MKVVHGIAALLVCVPVSGQAPLSFEGSIAYAVTVESLHERVPHELLVDAYGTGVTAYFKDGNTKMQWLDGRAEFEIYLTDENKQYSKLRGESEVGVDDGSVEKRELLEFRDQASSEVVLGRKTRVISIEYKDGSVSRYWYDPEIYMDPGPFKKLHFAYFNRYWQTARAPYLRHERITTSSRVIHTATEIRREEVDEAVFWVTKVPD